MRGRVTGWVTAVMLSLVTGCGTAMGESTVGPPPPSHNVASGSVSTPTPTETTPSSAPVRLDPCGHQPARAASTNLRVKKVTAKNSGLPPGRWTVRLTHVTRLRLPGGKIAAGNGYEALIGAQTFVTVADTTVTADVTMALVEGGGDSRVAFVELRLGPGRPLSWVSQPVLDILTDGGDGGFVSTAAQAPYPDEQSLIDHYVDALSPNDATGCLIRRSGNATEPDGFLFATGIGDGGYSTYVGRDARGRLTSIVHYGDQLPWALSGLPGTPPRDLP